MARTCTTCPKPLDARNTSGYCKPCWFEMRRKPVAPKLCGGCSAQLGPKNKSGLCRSCLTRRNNADPATQARRIAALREAAKDPVTRSIRAERLRSYCSDPVVQAKRREIGKRLYAVTLGSEKGRAAAYAPEVIARRGKTLTANRLAWCPPEYRDAYKLLNQHKGVPAAEARKIILARAREDKCARIAASHASIAADYLRRLAPVYRKGDGWQLGTVTLTPAQLVDRAMRRSWQPEDWSIAA